jgi:hypothetical protein
VGGASIIDGDEQAVVTFWNKDGTQRFVVMGLSTTDDVRTELRTEWRRPGPCCRARYSKLRHISENGCYAHDILVDWNQGVKPDKNADGWVCGNPNLKLPTEKDYYDNVVITLTTAAKKTTC